ncbi:MAG: bifunctional diaminohydroxyphosphoribosylaminopyrimidine deaminase/5-amino-6-(5-phosphoribosylamino)uracil reductase RibD [Candidatus Cloacimonetes bacterium]|nr:bifunctional diaminohydroxyphosphoribosylaminopyrimidine deaminase/5-amino-6-(5-phosphoribosylamino)uracil reductase RibD [Candidatus Cloacimonadota bacterium]
MKLAIRIAEKSRGRCSPNPFVGAVIVRQDEVLATGNTLSYGSDHAEIVALKKAGKKAKGAVLYVTLEPCSHFGATPPCTEAIIAAGIKEVFIGLQDPNPLVNGKGIARLKQAGIEVETGFEEENIRRQLEWYICHISKQRPFIIWKAALSLDGRFAAEDGSSRWISNQASRNLVHRMRSQVDAIITGINTILTDNPLLNVRTGKAIKQPLRIILDPFLLLPHKTQIAQTAISYPTLVFYNQAQQDQIQALQKQGIKLIRVKGNGKKLSLPEVMAELNLRRITSVMLEAGSELSSSFFKEGLVDKCYIFYGAKLLGGEKTMLDKLGIHSINEAIGLQGITFRRIQDNVLISGYPVYPAR